MRKILSLAVLALVFSWTSARAQNSTIDDVDQAHDRTPGGRGGHLGDARR
jgi:hypothetical protein